MSNLYRLTDEQVRNYRDAVTYTAAQQPTTFVARDHDKLLDALLAKYPVESHTMSDEIVVSATGVGEAFARKDHRIAQLEAQVAKLQPIADLEAENAVLKQAAGAMQRLEALPVDRYGELFIGRNDVGRWNCDIYEYLTHGDASILGTVAEQYGDTLAAAIEAALALMEDNNVD